MGAAEGEVASLQAAMAAAKPKAEKIYFSIVVDGKEEAAKRCSLRKNGGPKDVLCVGRYGKNHIVVDHPSVSNKHLELKLGPAPEFQLQVRDLSANGSGIQQPSAGEKRKLELEKKDAPP